MEEQITTAKDPGKFARLLAWFRRKSFKGKFIWSFIFLYLLFLICGERSEIAIPLLIVRKYFLVVLFIFLVLWGLVRMFKKSRTKGRIWSIVLGLTLIAGFYLLKITPWGVYEYISSYVRYKTLSKVYLTSLPETGHEVIHPRISVKTIAGQQIQETQKASTPYLVRNDSVYRWTLVLQPNMLSPRLFGKIETLYNVSAESSELNFTGLRRQINVSFPVGESLFLGANVETATKRRLSLLDLLTTETAEPRFLKNDKGEWVQVVPLIRWVGFFFPRPEFGGVNVISQESEDQGMFGHIIAMTKRFMFGTGRIYTPKQMKNIPWLQNQNLMPTEVSLSIANSFRYQNGFWAPMSWNHKGDIRIPVNDNDSGSIDEQPITTFFKMSQVDPKAQDMLYEYIGLPPFDEKKDGLVTSLFIPSDGRMRIYVYKYNPKLDGILGSTAVAATIRNTKLSNFWSNSKVTAIRCYNVKIDGSVRTFWKASIVTDSKHAGGWVTSNDAQIALVDLRSRQVIWVDGAHPELWAEQVKKQLIHSDYQ